MNWTPINYWNGNYPEIQKELQRVVTMAYEGGLANATWLINYYHEEKFHTASTESNFRILLEDLLEEQMQFRNTSFNPFKGLKDGFDLDYLAIRFDRSFLSTSTPEVVLTWLQNADRLDEKVQFLADGVCQSLIKQELLRILNLGFRGWQIDEGIIPADHASVELPESTYYDSGNIPGNEFQPAVIISLAEESVDQAPTYEKYSPSTPRVADMEKLHGFPFKNEPSELVIERIHEYLVEDEMIHPHISRAVIKRLFSKEGPIEPITFLETPGKLVVFFRFLGERILTPPENVIFLEDFSTKELNTFSYWLFPRLIGTFRYKNGEKFTTLQLSKSVNQWSAEKLKTLKWYIKMEKVLDSILDPRLDTVLEPKQSSISQL